MLKSLRGKKSEFKLKKFTIYLKDKSFVVDLWDEDVVDLFNK